MKNWISKISLSVSAVSLLTLVLARIFIGGWIQYFWWPLGLFLIGLLVNLVIDFKKYLQFLTLKTSRHGMTLGFSIIGMLAIVSSISYLSSNWNRQFDFTKEKLNTLSLQTQNVLDSMKKNPIQVKVFHKGGLKSEEKTQIKENIFKLFTQYTTQFKLEFIDAYKQNRLAQEYLSQLQENDPLANLFIFLEYEGKKVQIGNPYVEEKILEALIQVSRRKEKTIYYTVGHQEKDFFGTGVDGVEELKKALEESSFNLEEWSFVTEKSSLPENAEALLILGPTKPFFEKEIEWIEEYIDKNGKIFIALDPGKGHNLSAFLETKLNIVFKNNFVSSVSSIFGSPTTVAGVRFDSKSPVTRSLDQYFRGQEVALFEEVSEVVLQEGSAWPSTQLVHSDPVAYILESLYSDPVQQQLQSRVLGVLVEEFAPVQTSGSPFDESPKEEEEKKVQEDGFKVIVFGDSDFLANRNFYKGVNRDLALNAINYLSDQSELVSIRPKTPENTQVILTSSSRYILILFALLFPLIFFVLAFVSWFFRNRS